MAAGLRSIQKMNEMDDNSKPTHVTKKVKITASQQVNEDHDMPDLEDPYSESEHSDVDESYEDPPETSATSGRPNEFDTSNISNDEMMALIYKGVTDLRHDVNEMSNKLDNALTENDTQNQRIRELEERSTTLERDLELAKQKISTLHFQNESLQDRLVQIDNYSRRSNLIFRGIPESDPEDCEQKLKRILVTNMQIANAEEFRFERCHRLNSRMKPRPVICRFNYYPDRNAVWQAKKCLKDTKIIVDEDFAPEVIERRKSLIPIMKRARELNLKSFLVVDKLYIDDKVYTVKNLHSLPQNLDPAKISTKTIGDITAFCSKQSPLSNFYNATFKLKNQSYTSVEQYLQAHKAVFAEKPELAAKIRATTSPSQCKKLGDGINIDLSKWLPEAKTALTQACLAKFQQNERARAFLLQTGNNTLAEATNDRRWGIGHTLASENLTNKEEWGSNIFGNILMGVRDRIRQSQYV